MPLRWFYTAYERGDFPLRTSGVVQCAKEQAHEAVKQHLTEWLARRGNVVTRKFQVNIYGVTSIEMEVL